jgi:hypothetical protein
VLENSVGCCGIRQWCPHPNGRRSAADFRSRKRVLVGIVIRVALPWLPHSAGVLGNEHWAVSGCVPCLPILRPGRLWRLVAARPWHRSAAHTQQARETHVLMQAGGLMVQHGPAHHTSRTHRLAVSLQQKNGPATAWPLRGAGGVPAASSGVHTGWGALASPPLCAATPRSTSRSATAPAEEMRRVSSSGRAGARAAGN